MIEHVNGVSDSCARGKTLHKNASRSKAAFGRHVAHVAQCDICRLAVVANRPQSSGLPTPRTMWEDWMDTPARRRSVLEWHRRQSERQNAKDIFESEKQ